MQTKQCFFCTSNSKEVDYKDTDALKMFVDSHGKLNNKRRTGLCASHQRKLAEAVKQARQLGLLPFLMP